MAFGLECTELRMTEGLMRVIMRVARNQTIVTFDVLSPRPQKTPHSRYITKQVLI